jgi:hypothetical protein
MNNRSQESDPNRMESLEDELESMVHKVITDDLDEDNNYRNPYLDIFGMDSSRKEKKAVSSKPYVPYNRDYPSDHTNENFFSNPYVDTENNSNVYKEIESRLSKKSNTSYQTNLNNNDYKNIFISNKERYNQSLNNRILDESLLMKKRMQQINYLNQNPGNYPRVNSSFHSTEDFDPNAFSKVSLEGNPYDHYKQPQFYGNHDNSFNQTNVQRDYMLKSQNSPGINQMNMMNTRNYRNNIVQPQVANQLGYNKTTNPIEQMNPQNYFTKNNAYYVNNFNNFNNDGSAKKELFLQSAYYNQPSNLNYSTSSPDTNLMNMNKMNENPFLEIESLLNYSDKIDLIIYAKLKGNFIHIIKSKQGSKILPKYFKNTPLQIINNIFLEIKEKLTFLLVDPYANYLCQRIYGFLNKDDQMYFLKKVSYLSNI